MEEPDFQLQGELHQAVHQSLVQRRPLLHHLNADTSWLLQIPQPLPTSSRRNAAHRQRQWYNVLIDPWLAGSQSDVASWFSQQWHATDSKVGSIIAAEELIKEVEELTSNFRVKPPGDPNGIFDQQEPNVRYIDVVAISHEFTDHCHKQTLLELHPDTPVFATEKAASLIRSWKHFRAVHEVPSFSGTGADWRQRSVVPLPDWLSISRLVSDKDLLNYHSALMIAFDTTRDTRRDSYELKTEEDHCEAVIYTPHGIHAPSLRTVAEAKPAISTLAFLHGLHDVAIGSQQQLNLGAHNGLEAQRTLHARYWIGTHDEMKKGYGVVSWFLRRKIITLEEALAQEQAQHPTAEETRIDDIRFLELENGESTVLA